MGTRVKLALLKLPHDFSHFGFRLHRGYLLFMGGGGLITPLLGCLDTIGSPLALRERKNSPRLAPSLLGNNLEAGFGGRFNFTFGILKSLAS